MTIIKKIKNRFKAAVPEPTDDNKRIMTNVLCLHTHIENYIDDELGRFNGSYTFDSLYFFNLEFTQENANKVIEKFCPIPLGRDNYRLIKINELTMLINHDDPRLNQPRVTFFKYKGNKQ